MSNFVKPQSPIYNKTTDTYIYPLTTSDQVIMPDGTRLNQEGLEGMITPEGIGAMKMEFLWTNASPSSAFSQQTLTISNLSEYKWLLIGCFYNASKYYANVPVFWSYVRNGAGRSIITTVVNNNSHSPCSRHVEISNNNISFTTGYANDNNGNYPEMCVPIHIYGIK